MNSSNVKTRLRKEDLVETPKRICGKRTGFAEKILSGELGKKYIEYRKKWVRVSKRELVSDFPLYMQIEHLGKCNLRCPACVQGVESIRKEYSKGLRPLDMGLYRNILKEARQYECPSISFHNNDEPLLLNDLEERIRLARDAGFLDIILTTNATLLYKERTHKLLGSGLTKINFSVDAFNEEGYSRRRLGGDFNTVLKNINYFLERKKTANLKIPVTRVTCLLTKFSIKDKDRFYEFWTDKVDVVEFQHFQALKGYTEELRPRGAKVDSNFTCNAPWQQLVIRANGDVLPCCSFYGTEMIVGSLRKSSLYEIWNGSQMRKIREELFNNNFSFSPACKNCSETFYIL